MLHYLELNVNPKGRKTGDCSTRALTSALCISYQDALKEQYEASIKKCYGITDKETIDIIANKYGYVKMKQPRKFDNKKYLVKELDEIIPSEKRKNGVLVCVANHWVAIKDDKYIDIWDSGDKSVGNYWVKEK